MVIAVASKTEYYSGHIPDSFHLWRPDYEADPKTQAGVTDNLVQPEGFTKLMQGLAWTRILKSWCMTTNTMQPGFGGRSIITAKPMCDS